MAYMPLGLARFEQFGVKARYQHIREKLRKHAARRAVYRQTVDELQALDNRELADVGIHRSEIPRFAKEAAESV